MLNNNVGNYMHGNPSPAGPWVRQGLPPPAVAGPSVAPPPSFATSTFAESGPPSNPLLVSWLDVRCPAAFINASNVLDYFSNAYNPFYDRTCTNEELKMQQLTIDHLTKFVGIEYTVLRALEPLFVIRKQKRHNPNQVTPIADYYIISGTVYQAPDLCSVVNSRLLSAMNSVRLAFEEATSYMRYHPSKGYWWEFNKGQTGVKPDEKKEPTEVRVTAFQRSRVDALLVDLTQKFPPPSIPESIEHKPLIPALHNDTAETENLGFETSGARQSVRHAEREQSIYLEPSAKKLKSEPL